ncbi:methyltransferase [Primorskyibacter sp. S187A]|uniref:methyltransferase n=1 Tax=Primorskyibacter sp. S187A TaxID=3415130 RepID=UPI003C7CDC10
MSLVHDPLPARRRSRSLSSMLNRLVARPGFQDWASRMPFAAKSARRDGEALFDIVAGFVNAQVLLALVELEICETLLDGPQKVEDLARGTGVPVLRMERLLRAAVALDLLRLHRDGRFSVARKGAAMVGVPGLRAMIRHHGAFYSDMADPVALLRGDVQTELAQVWPYVFGDGGAADPETKRFYSDLMADTQSMVAADTLRMVNLTSASRLMDVGGGSGAFALAVAQKHKDMSLTVFDLPGVADQAVARFAEAGQGARLSVEEGSFRDQALPQGADVISLIRVLYDHEDSTITDLLEKCHAALPEGGRLVISEPMTGGAAPTRAGDVYFSFYTMAMQTGQARAPDRIAHLCRQAGFTDVRQPRAPRPFVTSAVVATKA